MDELRYTLIEGKRLPDHICVTLAMVNLFIWFPIDNKSKVAITSLYLIS